MTGVQTCALPICVDTIPVVFGLVGTRYALYLVNLLTAGLVALALAAEILTPVHAAVLLLATGYSVVVTGLIGRWENFSGLSQAVESEHFLTLAILLAALLIF